MEEKVFIQNALRTESVVKGDERFVDIEAIRTVFSLFTNAGNILDMLKKSYFYNKKYSTNDLNELVKNCFRSLNTLKLEYELDNSLKLNSDEKRHLFDGNQTLNVDTRVLHGILGIATEGVELVENIGNVGSMEFVVNLKEELGDIEWYKAIIYDQTEKLGLPTFNDSDIREMVINKLKARYGEKFTEDAANVRDLDAEQKLLKQSFIGNTVKD